MTTVPKPLLELVEKYVKPKYLIFECQWGSSSCREVSTEEELLKQLVNYISYNTFYVSGKGFEFGTIDNVYYLFSKMDWDAIPLLERWQICSLISSYTREFRKCFLPDGKSYNVTCLETDEHQEACTIWSGFSYYNLDMRSNKSVIKELLKKNYKK